MANPWLAPTCTACQTEGKASKRNCEGGRIKLRGRTLPRMRGCPPDKGGSEPWRTGGFRPLHHPAALVVYEMQVAQVRHQPERRAGARAAARVDARAHVDAADAEVHQRLVAHR